jgi:hypothetical protein
MNTKIIFTDILKDCEVYAEVKDGVLYVLLKEELRNDKGRSDLLVSEIIRRLIKH